MTTVSATLPTQHLGRDLTQRVRDRVRELEPVLVVVRRDLHAHPELSWQEHRTTDAVAQHLEIGRAHV